MLGGGRAGGVPAAFPASVPCVWRLFALMSMGIAALLGLA